MGLSGASCKAACGLKRRSTLATIATVVAFIGALVFLAHLLAGVAERTRIPDAFFLLIVGLLLGPVFHRVSPKSFGAVGPAFTTIALILILFEGGLELRLDVLWRSLRASAALSVLSFGASVLIVGLLGWRLLHFPAFAAFLLGAVVGGASPTVVIPLTRQLRMGREASALLALESASGDVLAIAITLGLLEAYQIGGLHVAHVALHVLFSFLVATVVGVMGALFWSLVLHRVRTVQNAMFTTPAFVFLLFGLVEIIGFSGAIAALAFGITIGNVDKIQLWRLFGPIALNQTEKDFFSEIVFLLKTFFFVYIGLSIQVRDWRWLALGGVIAVAFMAARLPIVRLGGSRRWPARDASLVSVMVPRGLAAAALAGIPLQAGLAQGGAIENITYAVIVSSIVLTSIFVALVDKTSVGRAYRWIFAGWGEPATVPVGEGEEAATQA